jgi:16S rRNA (cytosine967-C5)-methyltransferase
MSAIGQRVLAPLDLDGRLGYIRAMTPAPRSPAPPRPDAARRSSAPAPHGGRRSEPGARAVAQAALVAVLDQKAGGLEEVLQAQTDWQRLSVRDRGFARLLAATVLRRLGEIDAILARCMTQPLGAREAVTRAALRLGAAQLLHLATPPHAAVGDTVGLAADHLRKLTNAVLRRVDRERDTLSVGLDVLRLSLPDWMWQSWSAAWGAEAARAIAETLLGEPPLDFSVAGKAAEWAEALQATALPGGTLRRWGGGDVATLPGYESGAWWVQDMAAALPARLLGDVSGQSVIDLCAAPGGKTAQLASAGATVTALDRSEKRMARLRDNMRRLGLSVTNVVADATAWLPPQPVDAVLLDAPCSATGTIRRHPEIRWTKRPEDIAGLVKLQDQLLRQALRMLKPGGTLIYCTCSLQPEEGEQRITALLRERPELTLVPIRAEEVGGIAGVISARGELRCLPHHLAELGGLDGFYAARLRVA